MLTPTATRILHVVFLSLALSCSTSAVAQWLNANARAGIVPKTVVEKKPGFRALPGTLPQGRLYCSESSKLGYMRLHPQVFQQISHEEALDFGKKGVAEACRDSWVSDSCKGAQKTLSLLRKSVTLCW